MKNVCLIKLDKSYEKLLVDMIDEWKLYNVSDNDFAPSSIFKNAYSDFSYYLNNLEIKEATENFVEDSVFFLFDDQRNKLLGAINIRHSLNDNLLKFGGHIGYGIRPSERRKGYATKMLNLALDECKKLGIKEVLITCYENNISSNKVILNNNGILENQVKKDDGTIINRYWINLKI